MKNNVRLILLVMLFTSVLTSYSLVSSNHLTINQVDEPTDEEIKKAYEREVNIEAGPEKVQIESQLKNGASKDILKILFQASGNAPEIELEYNTESNTTSVDLRYKIKFERIVEYLENGTALGFQADEEISSYSLSGVDWNPVVATIETVGADTINVFNASTTDGVFTLLMRISASIVNLENVTFTPNSLKIDLLFNNFPYVQNDTSLALETKVKSVSKQEVESDTEEEAAGFGADESQISVGGVGFFSWVEFANADAATIDVHASSLADSTADETDLIGGESSGRMYFSFLATNASKIVWDPKVGVKSQGTAAILSSTTPPVSSSTSTTTPVATTSPVVTSEKSDDGPLPVLPLWLVLFVSLGFVVLRKRSTKN